MKTYYSYQLHLDQLLARLEWGNRPIESSREELHQCLNGGAASALRGAVAESRIKQFGAFFTGETIGRRAVAPLARKQILLSQPVWDPTCGGGDLLLRWAEFLPVDLDLKVTLARWEQLLFGSDIHPVFIEVAKRRLILMALFRGARLGKGAPPSMKELFPGLTTANVFQKRLTSPRNATLVMNPPFTQVAAPTGCDWSSGKVSLAAITFLRCLEKCDPGQRMVSILPDVLRSGSRYSHWRTKVQEYFQETRLEIVGRFDRNADVDVFILEGVVGKHRSEKINWYSERGLDDKHLGLVCKARVGPVVPYRDPGKGPWSPYLTAGDLPPWRKVTSFKVNRRFAGPKFSPPFVAVKRTSSPKDPERAIATIVSGKKPVALENHVIALLPNDRKLSSCEMIMENLRDSRTRAWIDKRIRCRHLTVSALRDLPIWETPL